VCSKGEADVSFCGGMQAACEHTEAARRTEWGTETHRDEDTTVLGRAPVELGAPACEGGRRCCLPFEGEGVLVLLFGCVLLIVRDLDEGIGDLVDMSRIRLTIEDHARDCRGITDSDQV
jgi:hypothetical protein